MALEHLFDPTVEPLDQDVYLRRHAEVFSQNSSSLGARLDLSPNLGRRCRRAVSMDQHGCSHSRMSLRTDVAMKIAERRGVM